MKFRAFKKCTKYFEEIYTKEKETKSIEIELDGVKIWITEQQFGLPIGEPHIEISIKDGCGYSMNLKSFIQKIRA